MGMCATSCCHAVTSVYLTATMAIAQIALKSISRTVAVVRRSFWFLVRLSHWVKSLRVTTSVLLSCSAAIIDVRKYAVPRRRLRKALQKSGQAWKLTREEWPEVHRCDRVCNILKNCKIHKCTEPCHQGPCKPCMESSNEDYVCPCRQTVVRAPIRCGTVMPKCSHLCTRQRENCEHPMAEHVCHNPAVTPCPKCYYIVPKKCQCGKSTVKAPCSQPVTSCGKFCEELLPCGHMCSKMCHKPGDLYQSVFQILWKDTALRPQAYDGKVPVSQKMRGHSSKTRRIILQ